MYVNQFHYPVNLHHLLIFIADIVWDKLNEFVEQHINNNNINANNVPAGEMEQEMEQEKEQKEQEEDVDSDASAVVWDNTPWGNQLILQPTMLPLQQLPPPPPPQQYRPDVIIDKIVYYVD